MRGIQKAYSIFLTFCLLGVLALLPEPFFLHGNVYRQLPLYRFLEEEEEIRLHREDTETLSEITERNADFLLKKDMQTETEETATEKQEIQEETAEKNDDLVQENENLLLSPEVSTEPIQEESRDLQEAADEFAEETYASAFIQNPVLDLSLENLESMDYLLNQFFIVDENTSAEAAQIDAAEFLSEDLSIQKDPETPQILIYHSHSQETFADSREGEEADTVVGVGSYLSEILTEQYGYQVLHVTETFDLMSGELDRSKAYDYAREYLEEVLLENPSIEVVIDLHRDGVPEERHLVTEVNGKPTAQILFYNGLSYTNTQGQISYLPNPYIQDNLAFSFQLEYESALYFPDLYRGIYLAGLRYNLHLRQRALLLEAGAQTNTVEEVKNAMEPFAFLLNRVLCGDLDVQ
jgi:stage II sporulation protein P